MSAMAKPLNETIERIMMVSPDHFAVQYKINPFMGGVVDRAKAFQQWNSLKSTIESQGVKVEVLPQKPNLPDMVFVCNTGLVYHDGDIPKVFISNFRHQGEEKEVLDWYRKESFQIYDLTKEDCFEGGGDAFFSNYKTLWAGFGPRSDRNVYKKIQQMGDFEIVMCELVHPQFYHLDTCLCLINAKTMLYYPPALSEATQKEILKRMPDSIAIKEAEAYAFVCNAITIRNVVISPIGMSNETKDKLYAQGLQVVELDMSEFMKAGGACQCLVLKL